MEFLKFQVLSTSINAIVTFMCYSGYNHKDSLIMNYSFIYRGLFKSAFFRTYRTEEKKEVKLKGETF